MATAAQPKARFQLAPPPGTVFFFLKTWLAVAIGYYAAFFFNLDGASSTGLTILILAQPSEGMVLSKAIYRTLGTLAGVVAGVVISALFPQDRTMLVASFAVWMGLTIAIASLLRDFQSYAVVLAGYTVAIISLANIDTPALTFNAAINRVAAIMVGIAAIAISTILLSNEDSSRTLFTKLRAAAKDVVAKAEEAIAGRSIAAEEFVDMAARLMPLRSLIAFAVTERPDARHRAAGSRSALLGLFEAIAAVQAVAVGVAQSCHSIPALEAAVALTRKAIKRQNPEHSLPEFDTLALEALKTGKLRVVEAHLFDRLRFLITTMSDIRDGLRSLRTGRAPHRYVSLPVHQDYVAMVLNAVRVMISIAIASVLAILSGIPDTAQAVFETSVFVALGSLLPDPRLMGSAGLYGMPIVVVLSTIYSFFIFPNIDGYPLFIISLAPLIFVTCWLIMAGQPGYGLVIGVLTLAQSAPTNVQTINPDAFAALAPMNIVAGLAIFASFQFVLPVDPALRRLRLALGVGRSLRSALADKGRQSQPRASLQFDRLSQFKTWQRGQAPKLARRRTMQRLVDLGFLAYAVRRSWRALDAAKADVPEDLDAKARRILPTLSPDETDRIAGEYLARAKETDGPKALALVHAAAALHGTALVTNTEARLLARVELLGRTP